MSFRVERSKDEPILVPPSLVNDKTISISARFLLHIYFLLYIIFKFIVIVFKKAFF